MSSDYDVDFDELDAATLDALDQAELRYWTDAPGTVQEGRRPRAGGQDASPSNSAVRPATTVPAQRASTTSMARGLGSDGQRQGTSPLEPDEYDKFWEEYDDAELERLDEILAPSPHRRSIELASVSHRDYVNESGLLSSRRAPTSDQRVGTSQLAEKATRAHALQTPAKSPRRGRTLPSREPPARSLAASRGAKLDIRGSETPSQTQGHAPCSPDISLSSDGSDSKQGTDEVQRRSPPARAKEAATPESWSPVRHRSRKRTRALELSPLSMSPSPPRKRVQRGRRRSASRDRGVREVSHSREGTPNYVDDQAIQSGDDVTSGSEGEDRISQGDDEILDDDEVDDESESEGGRRNQSPAYDQLRIYRQSLLGSGSDGPQFRSRPAHRGLASYADRPGTKSPRYPHDSDEENGVSFSEGSSARDEYEIGSFVVESSQSEQDSNPSQ